MKLKGRCLVGDMVSVDSYTSDWMSVKLHPAVFYRRIEQFQNSFKSVKGMYAELDLGQYVVIRFSEKDDVTTFHRVHHEYV
jgi:hypothetical protein